MEKTLPSKENSPNPMEETTLPTPSPKEKTPSPSLPPKEKTPSPSPPPKEKTQTPSPKGGVKRDRNALALSDDLSQYWTPKDGKRARK